MTFDSATIAALAGPRYRALADAIADAVRDGRLRAGERLPPQRDLAYRLGVTVGTVGRAYAMAASRGHVTGEVGRGTYVRDPAEGRTVGPRIGEAGEDAIVDLAVNMPSWTPVHAELTVSLADLAASPALTRDVFRYAPAIGGQGHRQAYARWLGAMYDVDADAGRVVLTGGVHGAVFLALSALAAPGDTVLAEELCYPGLRDVARALHLRLEPVAIDRHGMMPAALAQAVRQTGARAVVLTPTLHNPTLAIMPGERRREIAALAVTHDLLLLEDDVYGAIPEPRPQTLWSLCPERTLHLSSISKTVVPGLRLGGIVAPPATMARLAEAQHALRIAETQLTWTLFTHWLDNGLLIRARDEQRAEIAARAEIARAELDGLQVATDPAGLHAWLGLPPDMAALDVARGLEGRGVRVVPAEAFTVGRTAPRAIRLALGGARTRPALVTALRKVCATVQSVAAPRAAVI